MSSDVVGGYWRLGATPQSALRGPPLLSSAQSQSEVTPTVTPLSCVKRGPTISALFKGVRQRPRDSTTPNTSTREMALLGCLASSTASSSTEISTDTRAPKPGQTVEARACYTDKVQVVTFEELPARRWEHKNVAYQFEYFAYWRPLP